MTNKEKWYTEVYINSWTWTKSVVGMSRSLILLLSIYEAIYNIWKYFSNTYFFSLKQDLWSRANKIFEILNFQKSSKKNDDFQPISRKKTEI